MLKEGTGQRPSRHRTVSLSILVAMLMVMSTLFVLPAATSAEDTAAAEEQVAPAIGDLIWFDPIVPEPFPFVFVVYDLLPLQLERSSTYTNHMVVLVEEGLYDEPGVEEKVLRYADDVELTGLGVAVYTCGATSPSYIRDFLAARSNLYGAFFIGDIPEAWFEMECQWDPLPAPAEHNEFPCDLFFMDLDGSWSDGDSDGMYDVHEDGTGDVGTEIWFGRLVANQAGKNETDLVCNYLDKNHDYREGLITFPQDGLVYVDNDWSPSNGEYNAINAIMDHTDHVYDPEETDRADYLGMLDNPYSIVHLKCHGSSGSHTFKVPDNGGTAWEGVSTTPATVFDKDARTLLYNLFVCSGARYTSANNIGSAYILTDTYGLAAVGSTKTGSMYDTGYFYDPLGDGHRLGNSFNAWFDAKGELDRKWFYGMTVLGDPTLRVTGDHVVTIDTPGLDSATGVVHYKQGGSWHTGDVSSGQWSGVCDHASLVYIDTLVSGSTYTTTDDATFWVVEPMNLEVQYYQQHQVDLSTNGLPGTDPAEVTYWQNGVELSFMMDDYQPFSELCDHGSTVSVDDTVVVTVNVERYHTTDAHVWTVTAPLTATLDYIHQFMVTASVTTIGTHPLAPGNTAGMLYWQDGVLKNANLYDGLSLPLWMDEGVSKYSFALKSSSSAATHRWQTDMVRTYDVTASVSTNMVYHEQWHCSVLSTGGLLTSTYHGTADSVQFGLPVTGSYHDSYTWIGWCDDASILSVSEIVMGPSCERYHTPPPTEFTVASALALTLPYHHELKVTIMAEGLTPPATTTVTIGVANPSPADDESGGDVCDLSITLQDANSYTWTNWVHADTTLEAQTSISMGMDHAYLMVCWTEDGTRYAPPTIVADLPCGDYVAHYVGIKKTMSVEEAGLTEDVLVTIEVTATDCLTSDDVMTITDRLPNEFSYVMGSAMVDGSPYAPLVTVEGDPPYQVLTFSLDPDGHEVTFHVRVNRAYASDLTVFNRACLQLELEEIGAFTLAIQDPLVIHPYEGATLSKTVDGASEVPLFAYTEWEFTFIVKNNFCYEMDAATLSDNFAAELDFIPGSVMANLITSPELTYSNGRSQQVRLSWSIECVAPGEAFMLQVTMYTDHNPADKQEYTSIGEYELNSGSVLKWYDDLGKKHSLETCPIYVTVYDPMD